MSISITKLLNTLRIATIGPIARGVVHIRRKLRNRRRYPVLWKTPREIMFMDLENYEAESKDFELNKDFFRELVQSRDKLADRIRRNSVIAATILAILITDYFSIDLKFSLFGVQITKFKFFKELLLIGSCALSGVSLLLQSNQYTLESAMHFIILNKFPRELRHIYESQYLPGRTYARYAPTNLPYINTVSVNFWISVIPAIMALAAMLIGFLGYAALLVVLLADIWTHPSVPFWSRAAVGLMSLSYTYGFLYIASTRLKLPYRNYLRLERQMTLRDYWPGQYEFEFGKEYEQEAAEYQWLLTRGYTR